MRIGLIVLRLDLPRNQHVEFQKQAIARKEVSIVGYYFSMFSILYISAPNTYFIYILEVVSNLKAAKEQFKCKKCSKSYQKKDSLTYHMKNDCGVVRRFSCTRCGGQFKRKSHLQTHLTDVHKIDRKELHKYGVGNLYN